jgi:hypothetical protein
MRKMLWGLRKRAIAAMVPLSFAHVGAIVELTVKDTSCRTNLNGSSAREKSGKLNEMPCYHN